MNDLVKKYGILILLIGLLLSSVLTSGSVVADERKTTEPIAIMDQSPYGFYDDDGNTTGYLIDIANVILKEATISNDINLLPMKRLFKNLTDEKIDCTILAATPFTRSNFRLIESTGLTLAPAIVPKAGIDLEQYDDLKGLTIAVPRGISFEDRFDNDSSLIKVVTDEYPQSVRLLERGRVDAITGVWGSYLFNALKLGFQPDKLFGKPLIFKRLPLWLVCREGGPSAKVEILLKSATIKLRNNGTFIKIIESYLGKNGGFK